LLPNRKSRMSGVSSSFPERVLIKLNVLILFLRKCIVGAVAFFYILRLSFITVAPGFRNLQPQWQRFWLYWASFLTNTFTDIVVVCIENVPYLVVWRRTKLLRCLCPLRLTMSIRRTRHLRRRASLVYLNFHHIHRRVFCEDDWRRRNNVLLFYVSHSTPFNPGLIPLKQLLPSYKHSNSHISNKNQSIIPLVVAWFSTQENNSQFYFQEIKNNQTKLNYSLPLLLSVLSPLSIFRI
jgi:hypothetical protein